MISASLPLNNLHQISEQGLTASRKRVEEAAVNLSKGEVTANNMVELSANQRSFEANAKVMQTHNEMTGTLLNTRA